MANVNKAYLTPFHILSYFLALFGLVGIGLSGYVVGQIRYAFPLSTMTLVLSVITFLYVPLRTFLYPIEKPTLFIVAFVIDAAMAIASLVAMALNVANYRWRTRACSPENRENGNIRQSQCNVGITLVVITVLYILFYIPTAFLLWKRVFSATRRQEKV